MRNWEWIFKELRLGFDETKVDTCAWIQPSSMRSELTSSLDTWIEAPFRE